MERSRCSAQGKDLVEQWGQWRLGTFLEAANMRRLVGRRKGVGRLHDIGLPGSSRT